MSAFEIGLVEWFYNNYEMQKPFLLNAVFAAYPDFRKQYFEDYNLDENEEDLPTLATVDELSKVVVLEEVFVHQISKDGVPYVGYQFDCRWEEEHGLGVLMHNSRVVEIDGADCAYVLWIAEQDRDG
ncbi:hypothetical protein [Shimia sp. NS0008-38b]